MFAWLKPSLLTKWVKFKSVASDAPPIPVTVPRAEHGISRSNISENALKVLYRLKKAGYEAYLVGGGVRDLMLGREPKDFDVATDALPEEVRRLFRNCRLVGRRFRLAHVHFGEEIIEVATFRAQHDGTEGEGRTENGMIVRDNVYGTVEEDAWRRDFTVNALYYNIGDFSVRDYTGGVADLKAGRLRIIGDPFARYQEDPVRMLRAVRFAAKLGFRLEERTEEGVWRQGHLLADVAPARLFDEVLKLFLGGYAVETFELLRHYRLFGCLFPDTEHRLQYQKDNFPLMLLVRALANTDARLAEGKPVTPAFLFAALLWEPVRFEAMGFGRSGMSEIQALQAAADEVVRRQVGRVAFPKRFTLQAREIWQLQERLKRRSEKSALRLMEHPRFRAAYDFLLLRAEAGEEVGDLAQWWTRFQQADEGERKRLSSGQAAGKRRRRRRRPAKARTE